MAWYERSTILVVQRWAGEGEPPVDVPDVDPVNLKGWQVAPAKEIDRIGGELMVVRSRYGDPAWNEARDALVRADAAMHGNGKPVRNWWSGARIETTWAAIHQAECWLLLVLADDELRPMLPGLRTSVTHRIGTKDARSKPYLAQLEVTADLDANYLRQIDQDVRAIADVAHGNLRAFRNRLLVLGAILVCATAAPIIAALKNPDFVPVCAAPGNLKVSDTTSTSTTTSTPARGANNPATATTKPSAKKPAVAANADTCPTGGSKSSRGDVAVIEMFGALGGLLTVAASVKRMRASTAPYVLLWGQTLLKVGAGALTGLFGVMLMQSGLIGGVAAVSGGAVFVYAVIFGISQDAVTRYADKTGSDLLGDTQSKDTPVEGGSTAPGKTK